MPTSQKKKSQLTYIEELELRSEYEVFKAATKGGALDRGMKDLYNMVWGQCTNSLQGAMMRRTEYESESE